MDTNKFLPPPYTVIANIDVRNGNFNLPANMIICEIRCIVSACDKDFEIKIDTEHSTGVILRGRGNDIWRVLVTRIHMYGTSGDVRNDCITVFGYRRDEITTH